jgi:Tfp pilus assembly protein PilO
MLVGNIKNLDRICMMVTAAVACLCIGFALQTTLKRQKQIRDERRTIADRLRDFQTARESAKQLQSVLIEKKKDMEAYNEKIPEKTAFGDFLDQLDTMMKRRRLMLISIQPQPGVVEKSLIKIPFRMQFKGAFIDIFQIVYELETMGRALVVDRIDMSKSNTKSNPGECRVELAGKIFSR